MSHFTVLVIGDDVQKSLQPFHEFECTGDNDEFVQEIDVTAEAKEKGLDWFGFEDKTVTEEADIDRDGDHKYGFAIVDAAGNVLKAVNRTNPNKKWDWWQIGGRWSGMLKLKPGASGELGSPGLMGSHFAKGADRADQARKGDIDFAGMRDEAGQKAAALWDKANAITGGEKWASWPTVRDKMGFTIDQARDYYNTQPVLKALKSADPDEFGWDIDDTLAGTREEFVQAARDAAGCPFAVLHKGEWTERGSMGWWGCVSGEMETSKWHELFAALIDGLPDDTLLTMVDCHI